MAPAAKSSKVKEMFKPYNEADVPDIMPFPDLATFAASNGEHIAVPKLPQHQRSYILDIALRNADLGDLGTQKEANEFYDQVKTQALDAKVFQHKVQPGDRAEEASLSERINTWKLENPGKLNKKAGKPRANDGDASDDEEDEGGRKALLRGYTKAGWRKAIISNKRSADNVKNKVKKTDTAPSKPAPSTAVTKLLGLAALTGRDKFREDCHDEIQRFSQTLPGDINAGGKFAKAEAILWAKEDKASWDAMVEDEEVDWEERQKLVASGFKHMFQKLHTSGKFRPFMATMLMGWLDTNRNVQLEWAEAVPEGIHARQSFEKQYPQLAQDNFNAMYAWAERPLKEYVAVGDSANGLPPVFPLGLDALDDVSANVLAQTVTSFLMASYQAAFGSREIPWPAIADTPDNFYDAANFPELVLSSNGLAGLKGPQWYTLAASFAAGAGEGSAGFFRKRVAVTGDEPLHAATTVEAERLKREAERKKQEEDEEEAAVRLEQEEAERLKREAQLQKQQQQEEQVARLQQEEAAAAAARVEREEVERLKHEAERKKQQQQEEEVARLQQEEEAAAAAAARLQREEAERLKREDERKKQEKREKEGGQEEKKSGRKRKAEVQLVPEDAGDSMATRRPSRTRKTPQEAEKERQEKLAAEVRGVGKPSWDYVARSPVKAARGSTRRYEIYPFNPGHGTEDSPRRT
ncbi:hypothetical protein DFH09DRAFT_1319326 [Mycena vulgaris]|nr:hypothetical protein DFH09DRAFT_1319326 [Mycena vulgaris]